MYTIDDFQPGTVFRRVWYARTLYVVTGDTRFSHFGSVSATVKPIAEFGKKVSAHEIGDFTVIGGQHECIIIGDVKT